MTMADDSKDGAPESSNHHDTIIRFEITGRAAHSRIAPLLPSTWVDCTHSTNIRNVDFLWENAPRYETKLYRDSVGVYSHLPNGRSILDDKWVLARLFQDFRNTPKLATLESHCFRGLEGFQSFCNLVKMTEEKKSIEPCENEEPYRFPDLLDDKDNSVNAAAASPPSPLNLWVVKDAGSNGAGGIWVVGPQNLAKFTNPNTTPLLEQHRYVAQRYAWPLVLFGNRKFHVRVYGLLTSDGRAFVHNRAFLHVANEEFKFNSTNTFSDCVHITNCCANSHDESKFSGEICADFEATEFGTLQGDAQQMVVPLADFFPSVCASVSALAQQALPFLRGGQANNGFEYLGMDFILSFSNNTPVAYLLEVNAPPSQDTATGLSHAEELHNEVLRDLLSLWVLPKLMPHSIEKPGGWRCVYNETTLPERESSNMIVPSKAAILNKIKWAIFERKASKLCKDKDVGGEDDVDMFNAAADGKSSDYDNKPELTASTIAAYARSRFPYFDNNENHHQHAPSTTTCLPQQQQQPIFFENAGGSQVPYSVIHAVTSSLSNRHRSVIGSKTKEDARKVLLTLLGANSDEYDICLGPNASTLFHLLARQYVQLEILTKQDEVILCTENHLANTTPWEAAAQEVGATVKWWSAVPTTDEDNVMVSSNLKDLLSPRTRIVALSHSSNILGQLRNVARTSRFIKEATRGYADVICDGVSAVPHVFASLSNSGVDWYGVSCHKMFGPHLGALCGEKGTIQNMFGVTDVCRRALEIGTVNYEACAGVLGLAAYFMDLASFDPSQQQQMDEPQPRNQCTEAQRDKDLDDDNTHRSNETAQHVEISMDQVKEAYRRIRFVEAPLVALLQKRLCSCNKVTILESKRLENMERLPVVSFVHSEILSSTIVGICSLHSIACRHGTFLCTEQFKQEFGLSGQGQLQHHASCSSEGALEEGVVRFSLAHYNTVQEIGFVMDKLESHPCWW